MTIRIDGLLKASGWIFVESGFADYLLKPINLDRLQSAIRQVASQLN